MANLISDAERDYLESLMDDVHDTFKREIVIFKDAKRVVISTDVNYNFLYNNVSGNFNQTIKQTPQKQTFYARILYGKKQVEQEIDGSVDSQTNLSLPVGHVRIKLNQDGYDYIKEAKRVEFDGKIFKIDTADRPHGLFRPRYYTFYLKPTE
jgi:hypothetical protein